MQACQSYLKMNTSHFRRIRLLESNYSRAILQFDGGPPTRVPAPSSVGSGLARLTQQIPPRLSDSLCSFEFCTKNECDGFWPSRLLVAPIALMQAFHIRPIPQELGLAKETLGPFVALNRLTRSKRGRRSGDQRVATHLPNRLKMTLQDSLPARFPKRNGLGKPDPRNDSI